MLYPFKTYVCALGFFCLSTALKKIIPYVCTVNAGYIIKKKYISHHKKVYELKLKSYPLCLLSVLCETAAFMEFQ